MQNINFDTSLIRNSYEDFSAVFDDLTSYFIYQLVALGDLNNENEILDAISFDEKLRSRAIETLNYLEAKMLISKQKNNKWVTTKNAFKLNLESFKGSKLFEDLFKTSLRSAIRETTPSFRSANAFTISDDPETKNEVYTALETFRESLRHIGKKAENRKATGIRFIGISTNMMCGPDYLVYNNVDNLSQDINKSIAHDIRGPLSIFQMIKNEILSKCDPDASKIYALAIERLTQMSDDLLNTHKSTDSEKLGDLVKIIDRVVAEKRLLIGKRIEIIVDCEFESIPIDNQYSNKLERIMHNIIQNSTESLSGKIKLIFITIYKNKDGPAIEIRDTGCGISEKNLINLSSTKIDGHGIGLNSSIDYIKSIGGEFEINSKPGLGTLIKIKLPSVTI